MKYSQLIKFIEDDLNENNKNFDAVAYDGTFYEGCNDVRVVFNRNHAELYKRLLAFCAENGGIVILTRPGTYETVVRVETDL